MYMVMMAQTLGLGTCINRFFLEAADRVPEIPKELEVLSEKRKELSQTIASLIGSIRTEEGCRRCDFCQSMEDENEPSLLEEWDTQENLMGHLKSERFKVLRGAMNLLQEPYAMMFHTFFHPAGMKEI